MKKRLFLLLTLTTLTLTTTGCSLIEKKGNTDSTENSSISVSNSEDTNTIHIDFSDLEESSKNEENEEIDSKNNNELENNTEEEKYIFDKALVGTWEDAADPDTGLIYVFFDKTNGEYQNAEGVHQFNYTTDGEVLSIFTTITNEDGTQKEIVTRYYYFVNTNILNMQNTETEENFIYNKK